MAPVCNHRFVRPRQRSLRRSWNFGDELAKCSLVLVKDFKEEHFKEPNSDGLQPKSERGFVLVRVLRILLPLAALFRLDLLAGPRPGRRFLCPTRDSESDRPCLRLLGPNLG